MLDFKEKQSPGIEAYIENGEKGFAKIDMLLQATGGLSLSQVCAVTKLEGSTIQNWVKRGWVKHPNGKRYEEIHIARILIINALKECIKLEHISLLMDYVAGDDGAEAIKESELFNYLCAALSEMGQSRDQSRGGVEAAVDTVLNDYSGSKRGAKHRIRKALALMIYACVCTDVKRRTESMMGQILHELENPSEAVIEEMKAVVSKPEAEKIEVEKKLPIEPESEPETAPELRPELMPEPEPPETRKTIAQTLREWDISSVERVIIDPDSNGGGGIQKSEPEKAVNRPWFSRKSDK